MNTFGWTRRAIIAAATATVALAGSAQAQDMQKMDAVHFLIPGGAGGGCRPSFSST
jgi:putative tricarboxylic transport membrane protein